MNPDVEAAKVQLEGSFEVLEDARVRYARLGRLLVSEGLTEDPLAATDQLRAAMANEPDVSEHLENARRFLGRKPVKEVEELCSRVVQGRELVGKRLQRVLGETEPRELSSGLELLLGRIADERGVREAEL